MSNQSENARHVYPGFHPQGDARADDDPRAREARIRYYQTLASAGLPLFPERRDDGERHRKC